MGRASQWVGAGHGEGCVASCDCTGSFSATAGFEDARAESLQGQTVRELGRQGEALRDDSGGSGIYLVVLKTGH